MIMIDMQRLAAMGAQRATAMIIMIDMQRTAARMLSMTKDSRYAIHD